MGVAAVMSCGVNIIRQEDRKGKRRGRGAFCLTHYSSSCLNIPSKQGYIVVCLMAQIVVCLMAQSDESLRTFQINLLLPNSGMLKLLRWSRNCPSAVIPGRTGCPFYLVPQQFSTGGLSRRMQAFRAMKPVC